MNILNLFKKKPAAKATSAMPDYEQAILKLVETNPDAWRVSHHRIHDKDVIRCGHAVKDVLVLVDEQESCLEAAESLVTGHLMAPRRGHKCWTPNLPFTPGFCERFAPFALAKVKAQETSLAEAAKASAEANLRRALGI